MRKLGMGMVILEPGKPAASKFLCGAARGLADLFFLSKMSIHKLAMSAGTNMYKTLDQIFTLTTQNS
jgi:hypothetical protein